MIQLHYYPGNASFVPHLLLEDLGETFELVYVDRNAGAHKAPGYLKLNPNGKIPVYVDGGLVLYETAAICLHLVDTHPQAGLAPAIGTPERAHFTKWLVWMTNTFQPEAMLYYYPQRWLDEGNAAGAAQLKAHAEANIGGLVDQMEAQLASHGAEWFGGARYGALDPFAFILCRWTRNFARPARSLPRLGKYLERMLARPAVQRVLAREKLAAPYV
jgi:glutathione S-transferase